MKLRTKVLLLSGISLLVTAAASVAIWGTSTASKQMSHSSHRQYLSYVLADEFRQVSADLTRLCRCYVATGEARFEQEYMATLDWSSGKIPRPDFTDPELGRGKAISELDLMRQQGFSEEEFKLLDEGIKNSNALVATEVQAMATIGKGMVVAGPNQAREGETARDFALRIVYDDAYHAELEKIKKPVSQFFTALTARTTAEVETAKGAMQVWSGITMAAIIIGAVITIFFSLLIIRRVLRPIASLCITLGRVAEGDLTASSGIRENGEIGQMAQAVDSTVATLADVMTEIREAADQTAASGEELSASAQNISSGAQTQASSVEEIGAAVQELTRSIETVAANAIDANALAQQTNTTAESGSQIVARSIDGMKAINDSSTQIAKIIGVINQIANQTNLLALNAAIEAASAGEHGLGFAVVADEVRKLAERSSGAAQEIAQLIEQSGKRVGEGATLSQDVGQSLKAIVDGITRTTAGMSGISSATAEQALTAKEVAKNIEGISAVTEENSASAEEMAASAEELSAQAQRLQELVGRFQLDDASGSTRPPVKASAPVAPESQGRKTVKAGLRTTQNAAPLKRKTVTVQVADGDAAMSGANGKALYHE